MGPDLNDNSKPALCRPSREAVHVQGTLTRPSTGAHSVREELKNGCVAGARTLGEEGETV